MRTNLSKEDKREKIKSIMVDIRRLKNKRPTIINRKVVFMTAR